MIDIHSHVILYSMKKYTLVNIAYKTKLNISIEKLDLLKWFSKLTNKEYVSSSKQHLVCDNSQTETGRTIVTNIVEIGPALLFIHYYQVKSDSNHLKFIGDSEVWIFNKFKTKIKLKWDIKLISIDSKSCNLNYSIIATHPSSILKLLTIISFTSLLVKGHIRREGEIVARKIISSQS